MKLFFFVLIGLSGFSFFSVAQSQHDSSASKLSDDSLNRIRSIQYQKQDSSQKKYEDVIKRIPGVNSLLNFPLSPVYLINKEKKPVNKDALFYILSAMLLLLGILKVFYSKYFNNIFLVFFNTSLRQNQLTDLLLQARLPSLIFNIFFVISTGLYTWSLLDSYHVFKSQQNYLILSGCIGAVGIVYAGKFLALKFIGWASGMAEQFNTYIFITFLINKILGVILLPFTIIMVFGNIEWVKTAATISLIIVGMLFLSRYFRAYSLLQNQLKLSWFQFVMYILAIEIIPLLIIYKVVINLLS